MKREKRTQVNIIPFRGTTVNASLFIQHLKGTGKAHAIESVQAVDQETPGTRVDGEWQFMPLCMQPKLVLGGPDVQVLGRRNVNEVW